MRNEDRFWSKVDASGDCWLWTAGVQWKGYGQFRLHLGPVVQAHRFAYETLVGPVPAALQLDHLCRVPACVNPDHLEPVTRRENILRGYSPAAIHARQDICLRGHPLGAARPGVLRTCRECARVRYSPEKRAARYRARLERSAA